MDTRVYFVRKRKSADVRELYRIAKSHPSDKQSQIEMDWTCGTHMQDKDDADQVKRCTTTEEEERRQRKTKRGSRLIQIHLENGRCDTVCVCMCGQCNDN